MPRNNRAGITSVIVAFILIGILTVLPAGEKNVRKNEKQREFNKRISNFIRFKARQIVGKAGFTESDIDDIAQEMTTDLLSRLPKFDPGKAKESTFVARIIEHKISKLIRHRKQAKRDYRRESCSLGDMLEGPYGNPIARSETIDQDKAEIRTGKRHRTYEEEIHLRLDVSLVISKLPDDLRPVAEQLMTKTITEAAKSLGIPRTTLYGMRDRLRSIFENADLKKYL
jgi:RNA polymerase sigma-70 factor (ECF subfamily)